MEAQKNIERYLVVMSTTDCNKEEAMCSLVDAVSLRCLVLSIRIEIWRPNKANTYKKKNNYNKAKRG